MKDDVIRKSKGSTIWKKFNKIKIWLMKRACWTFGSGKEIIIGIYHILGTNIFLHYSKKLTNSLNPRGIFYLAQVIKFMGWNHPNLEKGRGDWISWGSNWEFR